MTNKCSIYNIPANEDFFKVLVGRIINNFNRTYKLKDVIILLPTRLSCYSLEQEFIKQNAPTPKIYSISDLSGLFELKDKYLDKIPLINKITEIVKSLNLLHLKDNVLFITELVEYLERFIHTSDLYEVNLHDFLQVIDNELSLSRQNLLNILKEFVSEWIKNKYLTKVSYNNLLIKNLPSILKGKHLIVAGINNFTPAIIKLLQEGLNFKNFELIFYGIDRYLNKEAWDNLTSSHPQYNFKFIMEKLGISLLEVIDLGLDKTNKFLSKALSPADSCYDWYRFKEDTSDFTFINSLDQHQEAKAIIDILKDNKDKDIMVVTPDEGLIDKLEMHMEKHLIEANVIRGIPLRRTKVGIWLRLCLNFLLENGSFLSALALFKHDLAFSENIEDIETAIRDKNFYGSSIFDLDLKDDFLKTLIEETKVFKSVGKYNNLNSFWASHIAFAEKVASQDMWKGVEGQEVKESFSQWLQSSVEFKNIDIQEYKVIFDRFLSTVFYRAPLDLQKRISILEPLDARLHKAEIVILAGLNEGIWPRNTNADKILSNRVIIESGFPSIEQRIGEEAYDFQCLAGAAKVFITRSEKINGQDCVPSRWFSRMLTLAKLKLNDSYFKPSCLTGLSLKKFDFTPPSPDIKYRPFQLSVTQLEKLIANPYHIYVDLILKLKKTPPIFKELSVQDFGNFVHKVFEIYYRNKANISFYNAAELALKSLNINSPKIKLLWWPKFIRIVDWFEANQSFSDSSFVEVFGKYKLLPNFEMLAKADRIDFVSSNVLSIIDYKTGRLKSLKSIYAGESLQLLLEGVIALNGGFYCQSKTMSYQIESLRYIYISGSESPAQVLEIDVQTKPILEQTKQYVEKLITEYQDKDTPYYYTEKKTINYCYYEHLARMFN